MNEYRLKEEAKYKELAKELKTLSGLDFQYHYDKKRDTSTIKLLGDTPIRVNGRYYNDKIGFWLDHKLPYVRGETENKVKKGYSKPNEVGVLSKNKILDWVAYLTQLHTEYVKISNEKMVKVSKHLKRVKGLGGTNEVGNDSYHTSRGRIVKNGIEYHYEIHDEGYISEKISLRYEVGGSGRDSIKDFLAVADNKFKMPRD